jgi:hypothetical protein
VSFEAKLDLLSTQLSDVIIENKSLEERVIKLELKLTEVGSISQENVYSELLDRQSRARNVILFNVPEASTSIPGQLDDTSFANDVFNTIGASVNPLSVHRLGKVSTKPRPLRITLPSSLDVFEILKVKRKLTTMDKFSSIRISTDLTQLQRKYLSNILSELKSRKDAGEHNIFVRYINGLPTISKNDRTNSN